MFDCVLSFTNLRFVCHISFSLLYTTHELINDELLWTPSHGRAKVGRPARTYIQQLCADTECSLKDPPEAIDEREEWRERVRDIRADGATWFWWYDITQLFVSGHLSKYWTDSSVFNFSCRDLYFQQDLLLS